MTAFVKSRIGCFELLKTFLLVFFFLDVFFHLAHPPWRMFALLVRQLRNSRAPGEDGIPTDIFKTCFDSLVSRLHRVITKV